MTWLEYLVKEREGKLSSLEMMSSGRVRSYMSENGIQRETTEENVEKLKEDLAEIEQILTEEGVDFEG